MTGPYAEVGGHAGMKAAVRVLYDRVTADPLLSHYFEGIDMQRLSSHQHAFLAAALGGPDLFTGRTLRTAHAGLDITDEAFDALLEHLVMTLRDLGVSDDGIAAVRERVELTRDQVVVAHRVDA